MSRLKLTPEERAARRKARTERYERSEKRKQQKKRWNAANIDKVRARHKNYYERNQEAIAAKSKLRYEKNKPERARKLKEAVASQCLEHQPPTLPLIRCGQCGLIVDRPCFDKPCGFNKAKELWRNNRMKELSTNGA